MVLRPAAEPLQAPGRAAPRGDGAWGDPHPDRGCTRGPLPPPKKKKNHPSFALCPPPQFSMQMDLIRQQLEFEAQHIRALMEERFGTADEMVQRAQVGARPPRTSWPAPGGFTSPPPTLPTPPCPPQIPASLHLALCMSASAPCVLVLSPKHQPYTSLYPAPCPPLLPPCPQLRALAQPRACPWGCRGGSVGVPALPDARFAHPDPRLAAGADRQGADGGAGQGAAAGAAGNGDRAGGPQRGLAPGPLGMGAGGDRAQPPHHCPLPCPHRRWPCTGTGTGTGRALCGSGTEMGSCHGDEK